LFYCKSTGGIVLSKYFTGLDQALCELFLSAFQVCRTEYLLYTFVNLNFALDFVEKDDIPDEALFKITKSHSKFYHGLDHTMFVMCKYSRFLLANLGSIWVLYNDKSILELSNELFTSHKQVSFMLKNIPYKNTIWIGLENATVSSEYSSLAEKHLGRDHELVRREFTPTPNMTAVLCRAPTNYELGWKNMTEPLFIEGNYCPILKGLNLENVFYLSFGISCNYQQKC